MKSLYVFFALFFIVLAACAVEKPVKVTGNIKGLGNNEVVLYTFDNKEMARMINLPWNLPWTRITVNLFLYISLRLPRLDLL